MGAFFLCGRRFLLLLVPSGAATISAGSGLRTQYTTPPGNTTSHHRVHHGVDLKYLDKNHGAVLIIWDRLFHTFQKEEERPRYGLTNDIGTFNPILVALRTWIQLFRGVAHAGSLKNGFLYLVKPPGWSHDGSSQTARQLQEQHRSRPLSEDTTG